MVKRKILVSMLITFIICGVTLGFAYGLTTHNSNFTNNSKSTQLNSKTGQNNTVGTMILYVATTMVPPIIKNGLQQEIKSNVSTGQDTDKTNTIVNSNTNVAGPDEQSVDAKFQEIKNIPYNEANMNCETKSKLFADYLIKNGGEGVNLVVIEHNSGEYSHEFVEWNGHYYDACNTKISYTMSKDDYLKQLQQIGFTGVIITSPYTG